MNHKPIIGPFPEGEGEDIFGGQEPNAEISADLAYRRYIVDCKVKKMTIIMSESQFKENYAQQHPQKQTKQKGKVPQVSLESENPNIKREMVGNRVVVKASSTAGFEKIANFNSPPKPTSKQIINQTGVSVAAGYNPVSTNVPVCHECGTLHPRTLTGKCPMVHGGGETEKDELSELLFKPMRTIIEPFLEGKDPKEIKKILSSLLIEMSKFIQSL